MEKSGLNLNWETYQINSPKIDEQCYHFIKTNTTLVCRINKLPLSHVIWYSCWNSLEEECIHLIINNWWLYNTFDNKAFQRLCCVPFTVTKILPLKSWKEWGISLILWANRKQMIGFSQMKDQLYQRYYFLPINCLKQTNPLGMSHYIIDRQSQKNLLLKLILKFKSFCLSVLCSQTSFLVKLH